MGEATNALVAYLAAASRKPDRPLAVISPSTSAAGKSSLMDAVLSFVPDEERIKFSAMTGQSLFYMGEADLAHKVLAVVLGHVDDLVRTVCASDDVSRADVRFTRRQVRVHCGRSDFQVRTHLDRLVALEYVLVHRGGRGGSRPPGNGQRPALTRHSS